MDDCTVEKSCGVMHAGIGEAVEHASRGLGGRRPLSEPYWGTRGGRIANVGKVIGWAAPGGHRRRRLDYDEEKKVHVNEEDFTAAPPRKVVHRTPGSLAPADTFRHKWASRYDKPRRVLDAEAEADRLRRQGFK
ncbi:MAG TPA: hypothetical protein VEQ42_10015 [Pyrinomonadaceae bacterium]|nr:hypothetical protein [Pyrinomonadaceae bacterium]